MNATATERMQQQAARLREMLAAGGGQGGQGGAGGAEAGKAAGGAPEPGGAAAPPPAKCPKCGGACAGEECPQCGANCAGEEEPGGDVGGEGEAGKALMLPPGVDRATLIDADDFLSRLGAVIDERVKAAIDEKLGPVAKALEDLTEAQATSLEAQAEIGKSIGALRTVPSATPTRAGIAVANRRPPAAATVPNAAVTRLAGEGTAASPLDALGERLKAMDPTERERALMPLAYSGVMTLGDAQYAVNHGQLRPDVNVEAVKAALDEAR